MARRSGADPPPIAQIQDHAELVGRQKQTSQQKAKHQGPKPKGKQKVRTSRKKKRTNGQQSEPKGRGCKGAKRHLKRQTSGKPKKMLSGNKARQDMNELKDEDMSEPHKEEERLGRKQDILSLMKGNKTAHSKYVRGKMEKEDGQKQVNQSSSGQEADAMSGITGVVQAQYCQLGSASDNNEDHEKEQKKGKQLSPPKKRQRTIFEYSGMRNPNQAGGMITIEKKGHAEEAKGSELVGPREME